MVDVAIVMAGHNEERFVERAIRSCLAQSLPEPQYQIVFVDDGSNDSTNRVVRQFQPRVVVLNNETHLGLPASINRAIEHAKVRYVVRVDADDYVHHDFLRVLHLYMSLNPDMNAVACDYFKVTEDERHLERVNPIESPIGCGIMFRKDRLVEIGLYDESFLMAEDLDLRLRFEEFWPIHRVALPLYRYRFHEGNMTKSSNEYQKFVDRAVKKNRQKDRGVKASG